jgi:DNA-directed RNA polymerase omega subunit
VNRVWLTPFSAPLESTRFPEVNSQPIEEQELATAKIKPRKFWDDEGSYRWPGIVSRFQLVILAGRRSKQLYNGAQSRIPADPRKKRNTSIALEELRRGLVPFIAENRSQPQIALASNDTTRETTVLKHGPDFDLPKAEYVDERT